MKLIAVFMSSSSEQNFQVSQTAAGKPEQVPQSTDGLFRLPTSKDGADIRRCESSVERAEELTVHA